MRKLSSALAVLAIAAATYSGAAMAHVSVGIYAGVPAPSYYAPPPVIYAPPPVVYAPQPYYAPGAYVGPRWERADWRERREWREREWRHRGWEHGRGHGHRDW